MLNRCYSKTCNGYQNYGGRGITVCERWRNSFEAFRADMGEQPSDKHQIDRIDNDGNYEPGNCRWATAKENSRNKRNHRLLTFDGKTKLLVEWADELSTQSGLNREKIASRLENGMSPELATRRTCERFIEFAGEQHSLSGWARKLGLSAQTLSARIRAGWPLELALTKPLCSIGEYAQRPRSAANA
jgi:hypothetical protein